MSDTNTFIRRRLPFIVRYRLGAVLVGQSQLDGVDPMISEIARALGGQKQGAARQQEEPRHLPVRSLLSMAEPSGAIERAVHHAQLDALIRLVPSILGGQIAAATMLVLSLADSVPVRPMLYWLAAVVFLCVWRTSRALRLRADRDYLKSRPPSARGVAIISLLLAALWWIPALLFFDPADNADKVILLIITAGLVSAASFTMATIPAAASVLIWLRLGAATLMSLHFHERWLAFLMLVYGAVMSWAVIGHAREFINHARSRLQLQEQAELLDLLQELQASGTGGLWELDANLTITKIPHHLAEATGMPVQKIVGLTAPQLMDPKGNIAEIPTGMRTYLEHLESGAEFRDLAVPSIAGRWWSLSGKPVVMEGEIVGWRGVASDVTAMRLSGDDAVRTARTDPLTGVANRLLVRELLEEALLGQAAGKTGCALLLVDLDRFKL